MIALIAAIALMQAGGTTAPPAKPPPPPEPKFSAAEVEKIVRSHVPDVQSCYEQSMAEKGQTKKNAPGGKVVVAFTITTLGTVEGERITRSQVKDAQVTDCILASARTWEFPKPERPQPVEFPFDLQPVSGKAKAK